MDTLGTFPFGEPVQILTQQDKGRKRVFVLGVYASAVHAKWISSEGKVVVKALAVASEPYIFWKGENAESIVSSISIPPEAGKLLPADEKFNGPSGKSLDNEILSPLRLEREDVWLCDLVPYSCMNDGQKDAIDRSYATQGKIHGLPLATTPKLPDPLVDDNRANAIESELLRSEAEVLILLGDQPIKWFLNRYDRTWKSLSDFGIEDNSYGKLHSVPINNKPIKVLPLAHPRQISRLGTSSKKWYDIHQEWLKRAPNLLNGMEE